MPKTKDQKKLDNLYLSESEIQFKIQKLAKEIALNYKNIKDNLVILTVLKGAILFSSDLTKELTQYSNLEPYLEMDFIRLKSRPSNTEILDSVKIYNFDFTCLNKKHILIIEDIIDTGNSITLLKEYIGRYCNPLSIKVAALLVNPAHLKSNFKPDFFCYKLEEKRFVYGYGMDSNELLRGKKAIFFLD